MVYWLILVLAGGVPTTGVGGTPNYIATRKPSADDDE